MSNISTSITELIGNTPLLRIVNYEEKHQLDAEVITKLEYLNPTNSTKDRIAKAMIEKAEHEGRLKPGDTIFETTSGNTGVAVAAIAAAKGYPVKLYIQDQVSEERTQVARAYGATVTPISEIPHSEAFLEETDGDFVALTKEIIEPYIEELEGKGVFLNQLDNIANPQVHRETTGPEIWRDTNGRVDIVVATVGTGGTLSGVGAYLKEQNPNIQVVGVEPGLESIATFEEPDIVEITGVHRFSDQEKSRVPTNVHIEVIDEVLEVETEEAYQVAREIAQTDGILVGTSSGAAIWAAAQLAKRPENKGKRIVALLPDTGLRYLSTDLFE